MSDQDLSRQGDVVPKDMIPEPEPEPSSVELHPLTMDSPLRRRLLALGAIVLALVSFFVIGGIVTNPETFSKTVAVLDEKRNTVMRLVAASTGSSAAISLLPGDAGTPLAEKLVDLSADFLVVIAAIYLEKYLLTILGLASFKFLIPLSCVLFSVACMVRDRTPAKAILKHVAAKLALFGIAVFLVVPASVHISQMIENTYEASINETLETAEQTTDAIEKSADQGKSEDESNPLSFLLNVPDELGKLTNAAQNSLNNFIEALAVMIVTSCVIPILVLLFFVWLVGTILGIDISMPIGPPRSMRGLRKK